MTAATEFEEYTLDFFAYKCIKYVGFVFNVTQIEFHQKIHYYSYYLLYITASFKKIEQMPNGSS